MSEPYNLAAARQEYEAAGLDESDVTADPFAQFRTWLAAAVQADHPEPNAMVLSTADAEGRVSARTVLLKGLDDRGFVFFTNRTSRKGRELAGNPNASLAFPWIALRRQVCVAGAVSPVDDAESDAYFATRPRGSQLAAWASEQSQPLPDRPTLDTRMAEVAARYDGEPVPRPPHWGGYLLVPDRIELWQGRADRLHDRLEYVSGDSGWILRRLFP